MQETRIRTIEITDARDVDGTPYEAAAVAFSNLKEILIAADEAMDAVDVLALSADLQRQHDTTGQMSASDWLEGVVCRRLVGMREDLATARAQLEVLRRASTFDPSGRIEVQQ